MASPQRSGTSQWVNFKASLILNFLLILKILIVNEDEHKLLPVMFYFTNWTTMLHFKRYTCKYV